MSTQYRFAHEYHVRPGETLETIAMRFGTSVEHLLMLNMNLITHVHNPRFAAPGKSDPIQSNLIQFNPTQTHRIWGLITHTDNSRCRLQWVDPSFVSLAIG